MKERGGRNVVQGVMCENEGAGKLLPTFFCVHIFVWLGFSVGREGKEGGGSIDRIFVRLAKRYEMLAVVSKRREVLAGTD